MADFGIILFFICLVFGMLGMIFVVITLFNRRKAQKAQGWLVSSGTVTATDIRQHTSIDDDGSAGSTYFEPVVEYTYQVGEQTYTSRRIAFGANQFDSGTARKKVDQYPQGKSIEVRYNPEKPEEAVLETTVAGGKVFLILGFVFIAIGLCGGCGGLAAWFSTL